MIYEKKKQVNGKYMPAIVLLVCIFVFELLYIYADFSKEFWGLKFVDLANIVAQFATAGAFYLGFHQYHRNKKVERQSVIVSECKSLIVKMVAAGKEFSVGENTEFSNIKKCCIKLGNLGSDFNVLFSALDEGIHKAIVRMHWQEMYFNELQPAMTALQLGPAVRACKSAENYYLVALNNAREKLSRESILEVFEDYFIYNEILSDTRIQSQIERFKFGFADMFLFLIFFFESKYTDDYMHGNMAQLDIRARSPLIAALKACYKIDVNVK